MSRTISTNTKAALGDSQSWPAHLVEVDIGSSTYYLTDAHRNITWGGNTYLAVGHFLGFSDIEEHAAIQISSLTLTLSGVDKTWIALVLGYDFVDREVSIYKAILDYDGALLRDPVTPAPFLIFGGRINHAAVNEDPAEGTCTVAIGVTSHWVDFDRKPGRHTNHAEQQHYFPDDLGFEYASEIIGDLYWGTRS